MKKGLIIILGIIAIAAVGLFLWINSDSTGKAKFPSYSRFFQPPSDAKQIFELSQNYPSTYDKNEEYPWQEIDFRTEPEKYMNAVLKYSLEGNLEVNFRGQDNKVRKWYHAPYMHDDGKQNGNGREYINGMTRERPTPKFEIHERQDIELESWAVGMYNEPGGYTLNQVWMTEENPAPSKAVFPEGTVSFKLLFTNGTVDKVPFLKNTLEWVANIYPCDPGKCGATQRENTTVRLLQIDIAVKDKRAEKTGWVFGTFMYDAATNGETIWDRMIPVGLSWGDDSEVLTDISRQGSFINPELKETYLNPYLIEDITKTYTNQAYMRYHGLGGRLNGPVDNPISSCMSCHGQSGIRADGYPLPMANFYLTRDNFPESEFKIYFSDVQGGAYIRQFEGEEYFMTDYSLQIAFGIRNFYQERIDEHNQKLAEKNLNGGGTTTILTDIQIQNLEGYIESLPEVTRGE